MTQLIGHVTVWKGNAEEPQFEFDGIIHINDDKDPGQRVELNIEYGSMIVLISMDAKELSSAIIDTVSKKEVS